MKILFVYFNKDFRPRTMLSISLLETLVKNDGHYTKIFDTSFYPQFVSDYEKFVGAGIHKKIGNLVINAKQTNPHEDIKKCIIEFCPDLIAFSYYTFHEDIQRSLLRGVKRLFPGIPIISGGPAVCISPNKCLEEDYIDMICFGEGEMCFKELCNRMSRGEEIKNIQGIWIKNKDGTIINNGIGPLVNLNELPIQNWDSYDSIHINGLFNGRAYRMGHVEFVRGCPYNCTYCGAGSIKKPYLDAGQKKYVRHKDPEQAALEYKALKDKYNLEMFYFVTGTFNAMSIEVLESLAYYYKKYVNLPFIALVRPETINEKVANLMGRMGCVHASIGVESGIRKYREDVLNRRMSNEQIINSIKYLKNAGIHVSAYNMIGIPGMDRSHIFKTIELNREAKPNNAIISIFMPLENDLTNSLIKKGLIDVRGMKMSNGLNPTVSIKDMSNKEIIGLFNTFNIYVKFPKWTYRVIRLLEKENFITRFIRKIVYKIIRRD